MSRGSSTNCDPTHGFRVLSAAAYLLEMRWPDCGVCGEDDMDVDGVEVLEDDEDEEMDKDDLEDICVMPF
ncbi:uncharacterized protein TRAVEDRAFT_46773 [Trametes versicolor FP-101664 SS1]|uniref:uncharacterized protein n=1 Tax=Trametes versicolor (strain FP-101664) TaxID=717944 RepID=UPI0004622446|nr:uncharacterized protein TRAVEDRAFT_46773 [Trametes versicolor FP-101664 SS1]EIW59466.1 hypothetical protein TRAVEDRAFT_46773 [Trametes versicolor FP-101664 SS1]